MLLLLLSLDATQLRTKWARHYERRILAGRVMITGSWPRPQRQAMQHRIGRGSSVISRRDDDRLALAIGRWRPLGNGGTRVVGGQLEVRDRLMGD